MSKRTVLELTLAFGFAVIGAGEGNAGVVTVLDADFDDKVVGLPIGTGGAIVNEPVYNGVQAVVRATPFVTRSLEIRDTSTLSGDSVTFELLNGWELVDGTVTITATLWFEVADNYLVWILPPSGGPMRDFSQIRFQADGNVGYLDENSPSLTTVGTYATGQAIPIQLTFRLDSGTYDVTLGGTPLLVDESHGVTDRGIGAVAFSSYVDPDVNGQFSVDDVFVTATEVPTSVSTWSWGKVKSAYSP